MNNRRPHSLWQSGVLLLAQGFGTGWSPTAPGTVGSLVGLGWFLILVASGNLWLYLVGTGVGVGISIWACGAAEQILEEKDPSSIVLDEIVALPLAFLSWLAFRWFSNGVLPPVSWFCHGRALVLALLAFAAFRALDIWKPWPVHQSQQLAGGLGVTVDDVLAALYVNLLWLPIGLAGWLR